MDYFISDYCGIKCCVYRHYIVQDSNPLVRIISSKDIDKALASGFSCIGYPDEIAKEISIEEYEMLKEKAEK